MTRDTPPSAHRQPIHRRAGNTTGSERFYAVGDDEDEPEYGMPEDGVEDHAQPRAARAAATGAGSGAAAAAHAGGQSPRFSDDDCSSTKSEPLPLGAWGGE